jgi:Uncharacterized conserved protein
LNSEFEDFTKPCKLVKSKLTDEEDIKYMQKLIDLLEDDDDVQTVYHNWEE